MLEDIWDGATGVPTEDAPPRWLPSERGSAAAGRGMGEGAAFIIDMLPHPAHRVWFSHLGSLCGDLLAEVAIRNLCSLVPRF